MIAFIQFAAIILVVIFVLFGVLGWVKQKSPKWRNTAAFTVAAGAAYSASFALDLFVGALLKFYSFSPFTIPVFTWTGIAIALHCFARYVGGGKVWVAIPYFVVAGIAISAGLLSHHKLDFAVGLPLVLFGILSLAARRDERMEASDREYRV